MALTQNEEIGDRAGKCTSPGLESTGMIAILQGARLKVISLSHQPLAVIDRQSDLRIAVTCPQYPGNPVPGSVGLVWPF